MSADKVSLPPAVEDVLNFVRNFYPPSEEAADLSAREIATNAADAYVEDTANALRRGRPVEKPNAKPKGRPAIVVIGVADEHEKDVDDASPAELRRRLWLAIEALSEAADGLSRAGRPRLARRAREVVGHIERGTPMKTMPKHEACCANEHRSINGGCESCGDPCL